MDKYKDMSIRQLFFFAILLLCGSCGDNEPPGHIRKIGLETFSIFLSAGIDSATVRSKEPGWTIYSILVREGDENKRYINEGYIKEFPDGSKISTVRDTMVYEWLTLIKSAPAELKIIVQANPSDTDRSVTVTLAGGVGFFPEDLQVTQKGND